VEVRNSYTAGTRGIAPEQLPDSHADLLLGLEVVHEDVALSAVLTPVADDGARAVDNLAGVAITVNLAC